MTTAAGSTARSTRVRKITVLRWQDARERRLPFQRKIGAGLTQEEFRARTVEGSLRHIGLTESVHMIAAGLGWPLSRTEDRIEPVIASEAVSSAEIAVPAGGIAGVHQLGLGYVGAQERIRLDFRACVGEPEPQDTIIIEGEPGLRISIPGGIHGDVATCAILTNAIRSVLAAPPGLHTVLDLPPITWCSDRHARSDAAAE